MQLSTPHRLTSVQKQRTVPLQEHVVQPAAQVTKNPNPSPPHVARLAVQVKSKIINRNHDSGAGISILTSESFTLNLWNISRFNGISPTVATSGVNIAIYFPKDTRI